MSLPNTLLFAVLAMVLTCAIPVFGQSSPAPALDVPGSAAMPLVPRERATPAAPGKPGAAVRLGLWVTPEGTVEKVDVLGGSRAWAAEASQAAGRWSFEPVIANGKPISARVLLTFTYDGKTVLAGLDPVPNLPDELHEEGEFGLVAPELRRDPDIILPLAVYADGRRIEVGLRYAAEPDGTTGRIEVLGASTEGALRTGLDLVSHRTYQNATIGGMPVAVAFQQVFGFRSFTGINPALDGATDVVDPAYPFERLLADEEGHAKVRIMLDSEGNVSRVELIEATHPDFGGALVAAAESWRFSSAAAAAQREREYRHEFRLANAPYAARRLAEDARQGRFPSKSAAGLDARPQMVYRPMLTYPTALAGQGLQGAAKVQFVIDRVGLAQVPRILECSRPEFGWAAVTLVNGMRFRPVTRAGKPAEITVVLPLTFEPPKPAAPAAP